MYIYFEYNFIIFSLYEISPYLIYFRVLIETREMLEDQLNSSRRRADKVLELESEILKFKQLVNDMALERAADKEKYQELIEENTQLHKLTKAAANEAALDSSISDSEEPGNKENYF